MSEGELANGDSNRHMEICQKTERMLKEKAEAILMPIVGYGNVVAMVSCEMDFNNVDKIVESYDSERAVAIQEKTVTESNSKTGGSSSTGGKTGVAANVSVKNPQGSQKQENVSQEQRKTTEKQFVVPKTVEKTTIKGGRLKKLTVAVTIAKKTDGASWTPEEKINFEKLVSAAVGANNYFTQDELKNNPIVTVKEMPFIPAPKPEPAVVAITDKIMFEVDKYSKSQLVRPILGVLLLLVLYKIFKKYFNKTSVEGSDLGFGSVSSSGIYGEEVRQIESEQDTKAASDREMLLNSLDEKSQASPQAVADILERWLASDHG